jgi:hypothetical protein
MGNNDDVRIIYASFDLIVLLQLIGSSHYAFSKSETNIRLFLACVQWLSHPVDCFVHNLVLDMECLDCH